ncbi:hypothetical protein [Pseudomonas monsensis]|uniref:hypothetical protein n=1 Tax=Pseudomonas monsensis TaxID=2745509 RepID=UPI003D20EF74
MEFVLGFKIDCSRLAMRFAFNRDAQLGAFENQRRVDAFGWAERVRFRQHWHRPQQAEQ